MKLLTLDDFLTLWAVLFVGSAVLVFGVIFAIAFWQVVIRKK